MKKIIYSLVIMIAAGSLFTSCIEQVEPVGLLDMRTAKAEYIRALKDLRAADAEYTRAKAAVEQANARYRDAETAFKNAQVENQNLLNELQELWNEAQAQENTRRAAEIAAEIEGIQMKMEELAAKHAVEMVKYEAQLAQAQEGLRVVLRDIAIASKSLSPNEKLAVVESAALVAVLTEAQAKAMKDVNKAQQKLDTLTFNALLAGTTWEDGYLEDLEEHYEDLIEEEQAKIVILEAAKALVPVVTAQLDEWQAVVDGYAKDSIAIAQEMAQQTYDSTAYVNATVKPGIVKFNQAISEFIEANWETPDMGNTSYKYAEPALTAAEKAWVKKTKAPARTDAVYQVPDKKGPQEFVNTKAVFAEDTLPVLTDLTSPVWFNKYAFLLTEQAGSYGKLTNPFDQADPKRKLMAVLEGELETDPDTLVIQGRIKKDMKDFILGTAEHDSYNTLEYEAKNLTASYGLKGAYAVMERVYKEAKKKYDAGKIDSLIHVTDSAWTAQNAILKAGLKDNAKYKKAIEDFEAAVEEYNTRKANMEEALDEFVAAWNASVATGAQWSDVDSIRMITAIANFAAAREEYLEGFADTIKARGKKGGYQDPTYVYFVTQKDPFNLDSAKIKDLTIYDLRKKSELSAYTTASKYEVMGHKNISGEPTIWAEGETRHIGENYYYNDHGVFDHIVKDMLGSAAYSLTHHAVASGTEYHYDYVWQPITVENIVNVFNDGDAFTGLLFGWKYKAATTPTLTNGSVVLRATELPVNYSEIAKKETGVKNAVLEYVATYNAYWGQNVSAAGLFADEDGKYTIYFDKAVNQPGTAGIAEAKETAEAAVATLLDAKGLMEDGKLPSDSYTMDYFKPYGDNEIFVTFEAPATFNYTNAGWSVTEESINCPKVDTTQAVLAVLTAIDPFCNEPGNNSFFAGWSNGNILKSAIFFGGVEEEKDAIPTTAYKALFWRYMKWVATSEKVEKDMQTISKWIEDVEKVFTTNASRKATTKFDEAAYLQDSTDYVKALARKKVVDAYEAKKLAFVGTRTEQIDGKDSVIVNALFITNNPIDTIKTTVTYTLNPTTDPFEVLFAKNLFGEYVGWTKKLDGQQLANAKEFFGEEPYEQIQDWKVARKVNEAKQATLSDLKQKAEAVFVEKAKVEGLADPDSTSLASIEAQWKGYVAKIGEGIAEAKKKINGDPDVEGDKGYAGKLADAIAGNIDAEYLIKDAQIELAAAEAKLEDITKMLEKAQANLDKIMEYIRSTDAEFVIPVTIEEIDALIASVKKNLPTTASSIAALIAAYMGGADEEEDGD